ncbi:hypothetical protein J7E87_26090 [Streptomyces sp. ISL-1]|uniref:hypothetical protein n=1 Tax=Streptomyces sp. ISL-1 TaxID=2817657 RepID=UPI001BEA7815|nr:hypothetical protein [Streptomyces sp. ISL-1]MBT2392810.1 hypothetical protein [Streptomyces sp. ISL-1]
MSWVHVDYENRNWVALPTDEQWDDTPWDDEKDWSVSEAVVLLAYNDLPDKRRDVKRLAKLLISHRQVFAESRLARENYLYFSDPSEPPLSIHLWYGPAEGEREVALRKHARVESPDAMLPSQVEEFTTKSLGTGLHSRTHVLLDDQTVAMNLWYAFRSEEHGVDLIAFSSSGDLGRLSAAEPHFNEFVQGIALLGDDVDLAAE